MTYMSSQESYANVMTSWDDAAGNFSEKYLRNKKVNATFERSRYIPKTFLAIFTS